MTALMGFMVVKFVCQEQVIYQTLLRYLSQVEGQWQIWILSEIFAVVFYVYKVELAITEVFVRMFID